MSNKQYVYKIQNTSKLEVINKNLLLHLINDIAEAVAGVSHTFGPLTKLGVGESYLESCSTVIYKAKQLLVQSRKESD